MTEGPLVYQIAAIPGDGVGPEVVAAGRRVLDAAGAAFGFEIDWSDIVAGGNAIDAYGVAIRPEDVNRAGEHDAILLGAVGGPKWDDPTAAVRPEQCLFALRGELKLYANLRPVTVNPALMALVTAPPGTPCRRRSADRPRAHGWHLLSGSGRKPPAARESAPLRTPCRTQKPRSGA